MSLPSTGEAAGSDRLPDDGVQLEVPASEVLPGPPTHDWQSEADVIKAQAEKLDISLLTSDIENDMNSKRQFAMFKAHFRRRKTDRELVGDYSFLIAIYDRYRLKIDWEVSSPMPFIIEVEY